MDAANSTPLNNVAPTLANPELVKYLIVVSAGFNGTIPLRVGAAVVLLIVSLIAV